MNSFQIVQAKKSLIKALEQRKEKRLFVAEAIEHLRQDGHRVSIYDLQVIVTGSSYHAMVFSADGREILLSVEAT